jgi:hypothetical protein
MLSYPYDTYEGPIGGLYLPLIAWKMLHRENIRTIGQLRAIAGQLERFEGFGSKTAQAIRLELDRVAAPGEQTSGEGQLSAWGA